MTGKERDRRKLELVAPVEPEEREGDDRDELEATAEALAAAHRGGNGGPPATAGDELAAADHEVLLALALGDEVADIATGEQQRAARLRSALAGQGSDPLAELAESLRLAHEAGEGRDADAMLSDVDHEALIALATGAALEDHVSPAEREQAEALRLALDGEGSHPLAELSAALTAAAGRGAELDELSYARVLRQAMKTAETEWERAARQPAPAHRASPGMGMVLSAIVAVAAGVALFFGSLSWLETRAGGPVTERPQLPAAASIAELAVTRSTQELFDPATPFPSKGGESERMGKIVASRAADLRANRFAAWGVR